MPMAAAWCFALEGMQEPTAAAWGIACETKATAAAWCFPRKAMAAAWQLAETAHGCGLVLCWQDHGCGLLDEKTRASCCCFSEQNQS